MQNLTKEWSVELSHFQAEELEERLENCWQGMEWQNRYYRDGSGELQSYPVHVPCGTPEQDITELMQ